MDHNNILPMKFKGVNGDKEDPAERKANNGWIWTETQ